MKKNRNFNLAYIAAVTYPIIMLGFIIKSSVIPTLGFLLLASFIIAGKIEANANKQAK